MGNCAGRSELEPKKIDTHKDALEEAIYKNCSEGGSLVELREDIETYFTYITKDDPAAAAAAKEEGGGTRKLPEIVNKEGLTPLLIACCHGRLQIAQYLHKCQGSSLEATDKEKNTVLHLACKHSHMEIVLWLVAIRPELLFREQKYLKFNKNNESPLHSAARAEEGGDIAELLQWMLSGTRVTMEETPFVDMEQSKDPKKVTQHSAPARCCSANGRKGTDVDLGIGQSAEVNDSKKTWAVTIVGSRNKGKDMTYKFVYKQAARFSFSIADKQGNTPFHTACACGSVTAVQILGIKHLKERQSLSVANTAGLTPLHLAAVGGHMQVIKVLLAWDEHFIQIKKCNPDGKTARDLAKEAGKSHVAKVLHTAAKQRGRPPLQYGYDV